MIGSKLRTVRLAKGLTLDEVAEIAKVSRGTIHRIEMDQVSPRLDTMREVCRALGISLSEFFREEVAISSEPAPAQPTGFQKGVLEWLEHLEALVRYSADSLSVLDREGMVFYESDSALQFHGVSPEERREHPWYANAHPEDQDRLKAAFLAFLESGGTSTLIQYRVAHRDGTWHWVRTSLRSQLAHPLIQGIIASTQDVTLLKQIEEGIQKAQKQESLSVALGGVTHTFSNLLMGVQAQLEMASAKARAGDPVAGHLATMQTALDCASELLVRIRDFAGNPLTYLESLDLNAVVRETVAGLEDAPMGSARILLELDPGIPLLKGDRGLLERLIRDLVANGLDALGAAPGTISLRTGPGLRDDLEDGQGIWVEHALPDAGEGVVLEVRDTGCGMSPDLLSRIFDPFVTTKLAGRGMGLSAVLGTVRAHRGGFKVVSELGRGSCFKVYFPAGGLPVPSAPALDVRDGQASPQAILVVDDDPFLRSCIREMLELLGHPRVLEAGGGVEALRLHQQHAAEIRLVLLDLDMPGMDGFETFTRLRQRDPALRIVFATGAWKSLPGMELTAQDGTGILQKPFRMDDLRAILGARLPVAGIPGA